MTDKQCKRCGEVNPAEIHTCTPKEPVAWMYNGNLHEFDPSDWAVNKVTPLYTAPPQREWQGLTDEDRQEIERWIEFKEAGGNEPVPAQKIVTYVQAKLKEKNSG